MAIHERTDQDGLVWASFSAMNFNEHRFFQGIFTVDTNGIRRVVGMYDYGVWDPAACGKDDEYIGRYSYFHFSVFTIIGINDCLL